MKAERIILVCDGCGADDGDGNGPVEAHKIAVDGVSWAIDACHGCWTGHFRDALKPVTTHAQRVRIGKSRRRGYVPPKSLRAV